MASGNHLRRFLIHGLPVAIDCQIDFVLKQIDHLLGQFEATAAADAMSPGATVSGSIRIYNTAEVMRRLRVNAVRIETPGQLSELYQAQDVFWLVDDRWGMTEIDLRKGTWISWVLPSPQIDLVRCAESAVLWPMAQLLRRQDYHLLPAASLALDDWGVLVLARSPIGAELAHLARNGFRLIGQRWTGLRERPAGIELHGIGGQVAKPRPASVPINPLDHLGVALPANSWIDLSAESTGECTSSVRCDLVLMIDPGRFERGALTAVHPDRAADAMRRRWPIAELHPMRRPAELPGVLAKHCRCSQVRLSHRPQELVELIYDLRWPSIASSAAESQPRETQTISVAAKRIPRAAAARRSA